MTGAGRSWLPVSAAVEVIGGVCLADGRPEGQSGPADGAEQAAWDGPSEAPSRAAGGGEIIAVTSGKGGVGKSNIAASLSILLARAGARVALVDADLGMGNLDVLMGVSKALGLGEVLSGRRSLPAVMRALPCGVDLAAGTSGPDAGAWRDGGGLEGLLWELAGLRHRYDLTILDCGSGIGPEVTGFCQLAGQVLVMTTPEPTALADAYGMIKALVGLECQARISVLVNFAADRDDARGVYARVASVARQFLGKAVYEAGYVLRDPNVPAAVRRRQPFVLAYPRTPASRCLMNLAVKLRPQRARAEGQARRGWWQKIRQWLE